MATVRVPENGEANQRWTRSPLFNGEIKPEDPTNLSTALGSDSSEAVSQKTSGVIGKCVYIGVLAHVLHIYIYILIISC